MTNWIHLPLSDGSCSVLSHDVFLFYFLSSTEVDNVLLYVIKNLFAIISLFWWARFLHLEDCLLFLSSEFIVDNSEYAKGAAEISICNSSVYQALIFNRFWLLKYVSYDPLWCQAYNKSFLLMINLVHFENPLAFGDLKRLLISGNPSWDRWIFWNTGIAESSEVRGFIVIDVWDFLLDKVRKESLKLLLRQKAFWCHNLISNSK